MSATQRGSRHAAYRAFETEYGTPPTTPAFLMFRQAGFKLNVDRDTIVSKEITDTRQIKNTVFGSKKVIGEASAELCYGAHDDLLEAALLGTWTHTAKVTGTTFACVNAGNKITDSGNGFLTAGFATGQRVRVTGFTTPANNAIRVLTNVAAGELAFGGTDGDTIADEVAGATVTIETLEEYLKVGSTSRSMTIERHFLDLGKMLRYTGVKIGKLGFKVAANGMVELSFSLIGQDGSLLDIDDDKIVGASYSESANTAPMVSARAVLKEDEVTTASISELSFDLDNGTQGEYTVGSDLSSEPVEGDSNLKGSSTMFFRDTAALEKWFSGAEDSFSATFTDGAGNTIGVNIPRVAILGCPTDVTGKGGIPITVPFQAMLDAATASNIVITRIPA